ncbi:serine/threonine protein kinase [Pedobacter psychrophilus]|uniref:Serine/threonine protein kinase n=1 Tax=Pedobacter psychrophilus TaxID=1826909 RepID=A0A179DJL4_9SPHI|nr:PASTA domain-containing protein [Pedobacter psychrophilus]OAQ40613.1 serine/threonine protein kinase [Pedobacter psychrophilus]
MSKFFKYLATPVFRKNLIIAFAVISILIFTLFISLRFYTRHGEGKPVPDLKGLSIEKAVEILENEGFRYQVDSVFILDKAPGLVTEQDPDANTNVKDNRMIYLTIVSSQTPDVNFPDIENKTFIEAQAMLSNYGLKVGDTIYRSDIARDAVLEFTFAGQPLRIGQKVPKGSKINLVLGDGFGASEVELPNLVGLTLSEAMFSLKGASLTLGSITYEGAVKDSLSAVIKYQTPLYNPDSLIKVNIGTNINVVISNQ